MQDWKNPWFDHHIKTRDEYEPEKPIDKDKETTIFNDKIEIKEIIDSLPWHETRKWDRRKPSKVKYLIIHQMASAGTVEQINNYAIHPNHVSDQGAPHIFYHYFIDFDGTIFWCNDWEDITWHCKGKNTSSIGIGFRGDLRGPSHHGKEMELTKEQKKSVVQLLDYLCLTLKIEKKNIKGHCEIDPTRKPNCPGLSAMIEIKKYRNET